MGMGMARLYVSDISLYAEVSAILTPAPHRALVAVRRRRCACAPSLFSDYVFILV